jgi:two-component system cell cycle sensor histidine kinase/response regulator CckA
MELGPDAIRSISHDMRNLLTAVRGHAELALRGLPSDEPAREDVAHVVVVTAAVFDLIDQLDGTDTSNTLVAVNLDSSVGAMRRLLDALLPNTVGINLAPGSDGAFVTISKLRVERIVLNLVLNARDAMDDDGTISITTARADDDRAVIVVSDTGPGFTEEALEHLFETGFTTKRERGGSGHGLSAVARFVNGAGGSIDVDSVAGEGATIAVSLPLADLGLDDDEAVVAEPTAISPAPQDEPDTDDDAAPAATSGAAEGGTDDEDDDAEGKA